MHKTLDSIEQKIAARHILTHPFYQAWQKGELTPAALQDYAAQYYPHVAAFPQYLSALHAHTDNAETRRAVLENLVDEEAGRPNHPELWLQFAEGVGISSDDVKNTAPQAETLAMIETFRDICRNGSVAAGLAALYSYESQIPLVAETKIGGLKQFYNISNPDTLAYFEVHQEADVAHSATERSLLAHHLSDMDAADAPLAAQRALDGLWNLLSGVCARHGIAA